MNHKEKVKLAKRLSKKGKFLSREWAERKAGIAIGVENRIKRIKLSIKKKNGRKKVQ